MPENNNNNSGLSAASENMLNTIQQTLFTLVGEIAGVQKTVDHILAKQEQLSKEISEVRKEGEAQKDKLEKKVDATTEDLATRVGKLETKQVIYDSKWSGPKTVIATAGSVMTLFVAAVALAKYLFGG